MPGPFGGHCQTSRPRQSSRIGSTNSAPKRPLAKSSSVCAPPARSERRGHVGRDRPGVKGVRAARGDGAQRAGERRLDEKLAFPGRSPAGKKDAVPGPPELLDLQRPVPRDARVDRKAVFRAADRRLQQFVEALGPMRVEQQLPARNGAGDGDGVRRVMVARGGTRGFDRVDRGGGGRMAGAVDRDNLAAARRGIEAEAVAAETGRLRFDDREHGAGRNRGVDGVAAGAQDLDGGKRGDRHRGRRHAVGGIDGAASVLMEIPQRRSPFWLGGIKPAISPIG